MGIVTAIYTRAAKGRDDGGGGFVIENKAAKAPADGRSTKSRVPPTAKLGRFAPSSPTSSNTGALSGGSPILQDRQAIIVNYCGWLVSS